MASNELYTWDSAVDEAVSKMRPFRRRRMTRRLSSDKFRQAFIEEAMERAYECEDCPISIQAMLDSAAEEGGFGSTPEEFSKFTSQQSFGAVDWKWIVEKLIEWGPSILKILMMFSQQPRKK